jgi:hypothetical protein
MTPQLQPLDYRQALIRGVGVCLEFVGIYWLTEPLFVRLGFGGVGASRPHLLFVGTCVAIGLTFLPRWRRSAESRPAA